MSAGLIAAATLGAGFLNTAGSVYTNAVNSATQQRINDQNAQLQWAINADQIEAARMNNETAINLANTAHQREVMDLRDANLNPILSANGNGSAVPALDTPGLEAPTLEAPTVANPLSGLASSLASAIQVNDAHELNDARLTMLGLKGSSETGGYEPAAVAKAMSNKAVEEAVSASEAARLQQEKLEFERLKLSLDRVLYSKVFGDSIDDKSEGYKLSLEGLISDLKMRANQNMRAGINSATSIGNAASNIGGTIKSFMPKSWFK